MQAKALVIDGSQGEGGGQVLRTSLSLSMCLQRSIEVINIRAARPKPGLRPQHLACVKAAAKIACAQVQGAELNSRRVVFSPQSVLAGKYHFDIGTAGSSTLVLQTVLPALMLSAGVSDLTIHGGTHNPMAPPYEFLLGGFLPLLEQMGPGVEMNLERVGFAPVGGGIVRVRINPVRQLQAIDIPDRGKLVQKSAKILLCNLPGHIADREASVIAAALSIPVNDIQIIEDGNSSSVGNMVSITIKSRYISEVFTELGRKGLSAEAVAQRVVARAQAYLNKTMPVSEYLADQLLLPCALAEKGSFVTANPSTHTLTNMEVIRQFTNNPFNLKQLKSGDWQISL